MFGIWFGLVILVLVGLLIYLDNLIGTDGFLIAVAGLVLIAGAIVTLLLIDAEYSPIAAENAQKYCASLGYDTYDDYSRKPFGTVAYGVQCNYIANRQELITNSDTVVAVQSTN